MRPGPPPKPTALKVLEGNPGGKRLNPNEPKPPVKVPPPPRELSDHARKIYRKLGKRLMALGIVAEIDEAALAILSESYAAYLAMIVEARKAGPIIILNGQPVANPCLGRADREAEKVRKLLSEFGGTPAARARVSDCISVPADADDLEGFLRHTAPRMRIAQ